ncbi:hypothetical protein ABKN59_002790 [Abortiporus biennis]
MTSFAITRGTTKALVERVNDLHCMLHCNPDLHGTTSTQYVSFTRNGNIDAITVLNDQGSSLSQCPVTFG